jgi:mevalonate kinase
MNQHQEVERKMSASTKWIFAMCDAALKTGALGAKQVGAGVSGRMIALTPENPEILF